ncbi:MAG: hypothetical protein ABIH37_03465 [archaeon]
MEINKETIKDFVKKIKQNKKYNSISDDIVEKEINNYIRKFNADLYDDKFALKKIRKELHRLYSSYQTKGKRKRDDYLKELELILHKQGQTSQLLEVTKKILSTTLSCNERFENYPTLYNEIFKITKKPKTILDLGAGLNPVSYSFMNLTKLKYYSYDIDLEDIKFLNKFFKIMKPKGLNGKASELDIRDLNKVSKLPSSDVIFMFKVYDLIIPKNKKKKKIGEELIKLLLEKSKYLVVSFATKTLTRKSMKLPRRIGFEMMLDRNQIKHKLIETNNEIFYVISKK